MIFFQNTIFNRDKIKKSTPPLYYIDNIERADDVLSYNSIIKL